MTSTLNTVGLLWSVLVAVTTTGEVVPGVNSGTFTVPLEIETADTGQLARAASFSTAIIVTP